MRSAAGPTIWATRSATRAESLRLLAWWRGELDSHVRGRGDASGLRGAARTVERHQLPAEPFADLIRAFVQDQTVTRYATCDELFGYCRYSANPVGRLVLYLCGYRDAERQRLSDATCTALQLANFWQDVTVDCEKDRVYMPLDVLRAARLHGGRNLRGAAFTPAFRAAMREVVERARALFHEGLPLARMVDRRLALDLELFSRGGMRCSTRSSAGLRRACRAGRHLQGRARRGCCSRRCARGAFTQGGVMATLEAVLRILPPRRPHAGPRISTTPSCCCRPSSAETPCAPSTPSCATATTSATSRARRARRSSAGAASWTRARRAGYGQPAVARLSRHGGALRDPARVLPRNDRRRQLRPGAAHHRDLRRALPLLLPGGLGGGPDRHPHLRLRVAGRAAAGREVRHGVPVDQHPARRARRLPNAAASICRPRTWSDSAWTPAGQNGAPERQHSSN